MSMSLNRVELIGNLTKTPEAKEFQNGSKMVSFSVATNRTYKTDDGEKKDLSEFHNVVAFGKIVDSIMQYLIKGCKVFIEGRLQTRSYETKTGEKRYATEIVLQNFILLKNSNNQKAEEQEEDCAVEDIF